MKINILTLFPEMFTGPFDFSIVKRAKEKGLVSVDIINIRDFATDTYKTVDDHPYGGGPGMILRVDVVDRALEHIQTKGRTILLDPGGTPYTQKKARQLSTLKNITLICGHYEGVDERIRLLVDESLSIGDYVVTGGELPAMVVVDSIVRLIRGVLGDESSNVDESFSRENRIEYPQYTRPPTYKSMTVPKVLTSGNHKEILAWKSKRERTRSRRK